MVASQASLTTGFPRQEYWSGLPFPFPGDLPDLGIEPVFPALAGRFCTTEPPGTPTSLVVIYPLTGIFYLLTTFTHSNSPPTLVTTNMISFLPSLSKYNTMLVPGVPRSDSIFLYITKWSPQWSGYNMLPHEDIISLLSILFHKIWSSFILQLEVCTS